jgi:hypothetical protein
MVRSQYGATTEAAESLIAQLYSQFGEILKANEHAP